jgi:biopolymer transport protein ExbD
MRYQRNLKPFTGRLDVAPVAGVLFLLLLFLLLQTSLAPVPGLRVELPTVDLREASAGPGPVLVVTVDQHELVYFEHQVIGDEALRARLVAKSTQSREPLSLLVQADAAVKHAAIVRLAALARQAGITDIVIGTRPPLFPPGSERPGPP